MRSAHCRVDLGGGLSERRVMLHCDPLKVGQSHRSQRRRSGERHDLRSSGQWAGPPTFAVRPLVVIERFLRRWLVMELFLFAANLDRNPVHAPNRPGTSEPTSPGPASAFDTSCTSRWLHARIAEPDANGYRLYRHLGSCGFCLILLDAAHPGCDGLEGDHGARNRGNCDSRIFVSWAFSASDAVHRRRSTSRRRFIRMARATE